ncbi:MAG: TAXI family TRAP transporter solute-binding subunit [Proteobacteria bacterium]|nr:TAXI family TRAP transporter solute-binding subunit [Pseudomonadota bacterium]MBU1388620.1 TAXI family TRAP transporter solute-binding subunit [Pseudomonadota bacterium]MBU1541776.1 TAXI family TRAP transporter solute-binding subunit [Pseudomonadota bacterium]MBU2482324.1 TAXI family TRAP transporter solute-binding subunit [Pseudomonadota bacterium]
MKKQMYGILAVVLILALAVGGSALAAKKRLAFGGGPTGGTFQYFANGIAILLSKNIENLEVSSEGTGGSAENLKRLNSGDVDFGIVYSVDLFLGSKGELPKDAKQYAKVRPMAYLYGAPAQLAVLKSSGITDPMQLEGRKVAVGNAGSGAALSAQRYFEALGIWSKMQPQFLGYSAAASALGDGKIDGFWVLVGYPNASIIEAGTTNDILLLDLDKAGRESGFYDKFSAYSATSIPAGTYKGQNADINTFQDSTLWCAREQLNAETVYQALKVVFSAEGLEHMLKAHKAAGEMSVPNGIKGVPLPLHPGADKFWAEQGVQIPDAIKAQ